MKGLIKWIILALIIFGLTFGGAYYYQQSMNKKLGGQVQSIATTSLQGLREEKRLTVFAESFTALVGGEPTIIMPGLVRYEVDLTKVQPRDVKWNDKSRTLNVVLPPLILTGPEVDTESIRQVGEGGVLTVLTDAEATLDSASLKRGQDDVLKQAKGEVPMSLARDAGRKAIERSFAMPLRAAGIKAAVLATFADEQGM